MTSLPANRDVSRVQQEAFLGTPCGCRKHAPLDQHLEAPSCRCCTDVKPGAWNGVPSHWSPMKTARYSFNLDREKKCAVSVLNVLERITIKVVVSMGLPLE